MSNSPKKVNSNPEMDYFMNEAVSDVFFIIDGKTLPAQKAILSLKSRVFRTMFLSKFKESTEKEVPIEDTTYEAFKSFVQVLYCDELSIEEMTDCEAIDLLQELLQLSDRYDSPRVATKAKEYLNKIVLGYKTIVSIARIAIEYHIQELTDKVIAFVEQEFDYLVQWQTKLFMQLNVLLDNKLFESMINKYKTINSELKTINSEVSQLRNTLSQIRSARKK